jgi:hypothetical protein
MINYLRKLPLHVTFRCSELIANALSDITLATLSNNLKSVGFSLSKQIGIDLKSTGLFLVRFAADKHLFDCCHVKHLNPYSLRCVPLIGFKGNIAATVLIASSETAIM